jgi:undecaprenyl-diphosphatase
MLSSIEILILATIQGVSEFIPVSSAAHLILITEYYAFNNKNLLIDICLHLGSLLAITVYFRNELFNFNNNKKFLIKILIATIPIIPIGLILYQTGLIEQFRNLKIIAWMTLIFGIILYLSDKKKTTSTIESSFTKKSALLFGLFQVLALIPGVSRSGITITAGRIMGYDRFESAKVSFLLAIPALTAASALGVYNIYKEESPELNFLAIIAILFSFIFSYITIALFLNFIKKFSLKIFVIYRIILSLFLLSIVYL